MSVPDANVPDIRNVMTQLVGRTAWGAALGVGSFVTVEFGEAQPPRGGAARSHGEWHLWVYCAAWRLETATDVLAGSEDDRVVLERAVKQLDGLALTAADVRSPSLEVAFEFAGGTVLRVFPIFSRDFEHWMLFTPDGRVLTAGPGTAWSYEVAERRTA